MVDSATVSAANGSKAEDATRGRPYYDKLRKDLKDILEKKRELNKTMANLESTIARAENAYLEETSAAGNIIKGFDNYIKASVAGGGASAAGGTATRRKGGVSEQDRIFSKSSVSWSTDVTAPLIININNHSTTPSEAPTPNGTMTSSRNTPTAASGKAGSKNKKRAVAEKKEDDIDDERALKRGKVSWGVRD